MAPAVAGPSFDRWVQRTDPEVVPFDDGVTLWVGDRRDEHGPLLGTGETGSGIHLQRDLLDRPQGLRLRLGASLRHVADDSRRTAFSLDGSELSMPLGAGRAYLSQERRHWGPGWAGSLILDGSAPALAAVGWRKSDATPSEHRWLSWIGPWQADLFIGGLAGHDVPRRPWLIGMRIVLKPVEGLDLGLSRTLQWGGRGRDESLRSFGRALIGRDNVGDDGIDDRNQPGNQMAGVDLRYGRAWSERLDWAVYGQAIGEDESGGLPSKYLVQAGAELGARTASSDGASLRWRAFLEWSDTGMLHAYDELQPGAYRHAAFRAGYTHEGRALGHPVGGDAELFSLGGVVSRGAVQAALAVHRGRALPGSQYYVPGERLTALGAAVAVTTSSLWRWGASLNLLRHGGDTRHTAQGWVERGF